MPSRIDSFIERVLLLENYSAPLRAVTIDGHEPNSETFQKNLSRIFLLPTRQIMDHRHWAGLGKRITKSIAEQDFISWVSEERLISGDHKSRKLAQEKIDAHRQELIRKLSNYLNDEAQFAHDAIRNIVFLASDGALIYDPYEIDENKISISPLIRQFVFNKLVSRDKDSIPQDEYSFWLKTTSLLLQPVSQSFKDDFQHLFEYTIPFGLSPETESQTLSNLLSHANKIALFPLIQGTSEVGNAIASHQWGVAVEAAATTGATIIIIMSSIAILDKLSQWSRSKDEN